MKPHRGAGKLSSIAKIVLPISTDCLSNPIWPASERRASDWLILEFQMRTRWQMSQRSRLYYLAPELERIIQIDAKMVACALASDRRIPRSFNGGDSRLTWK